jgi:D-alanyl-D-alanine dipeptidase
MEASGTDGFVDVVALQPSIRAEIRYATSNNFTHRAIYPPSARCYLRTQVAQRLQLVQRELQPLSLGLKVFDCYRPLSAQKALWEVVPDPRYVAPPDKGSRHNRGAAVDLTIVDSAGNELAMPTPYDTFSVRSHRDYMELPADVLANRNRLEAVMVRHGFVPLPTEWWHFDDAEFKSYPLSDVSFELLNESRQRGSGRTD